MFRGLTEAEQFRAALPVLLIARQLVVDGEEPLQAIAIAGNCGIESEYARRVLRTVTSWNLVSWQEDFNTRQSDRTRAFDRAISLARSAFGHKGGWHVGAIGAA